MFKKIAGIALAAMLIGSTAVVAASAAETDEVVAAADDSAVAAADDSAVAAADDSAVGTRRLCFSRRRQQDLFRR